MNFLFPLKPDWTHNLFLAASPRSPTDHPGSPHKPKTKLAMLLAQADEPLQAKTKLTDWPHGAMATEATESGPSDVDKRVLAMCYKKASMIYNRRKSGTSQMNKRGIKNKRRPKEERGTRAAILRELPVASLQAISRTMACKASEISAQSWFSYFSQDTFETKGKCCLQCINVVRMNPDKTGASSH